jgi:hypothetical protein
MSRDGHLSPEEIESAVENVTLPAALDAHLAACPTCVARVEQARRVESALGRIARGSPPVDLASRIVRQLPAERFYPASASGERRHKGIAVLFALVSLALVYQTAFDLQVNGVLDLLSVYSSQPDILATYPAPALGALIGAVPWLTMFLLTAALTATLVSWASSPRRPYRHSHR